MTAAQLVTKGQRLAARGQFGQARAAYAQALSRAPDLVAAHVALALLSWEQAQDADGALAALAPLPPDFSVLQARAALLSRLGRFAEARQIAWQAHLLEPTHPMPLLTLAETGPVPPGDPLIPAAHRIADAPDTPADQRSLAHTVLGKAYADQNDPARAVLHVQMANDLNDADPHLDRSLALLTRNRAVYPLPQPPEMDLGKQMIFIIGMPRSGTTLVERMLGAHPRIAMGGERQEMGLLSHAFARQAVQAAPDLTPTAAIQRFHTTPNLTALGQDYLTRVVQGRKGWVTDKNPANIWATGLIASVFPDAAIIHLQRDPLDCCWSCYRAAFRAGLGFTNRQTSLGLYFRHYHAMMAHWHQVLPGRILNVAYEALVTDPNAQARRILTHCGLDWHPDCAHPDRTPGPVATASAWQVRQPIHGGSVGAARPMVP